VVLYLVFGVWSLVFGLSLRPLTETLVICPAFAYNPLVQTTEPSSSDATLHDQVQAVLDRIRPAIQADGGDVELVNIQKNIAHIRFHGACHGCPSSTMTLQHGIERTIRDKFTAETQRQGDCPEACKRALLLFHLFI
jgi:Fe-S cluster biogenesis protein NfuA